MLLGHVARFWCEKRDRTVEPQTMDGGQLSHLECAGEREEGSIAVRMHHHHHRRARAGLQQRSCPLRWNWNIGVSEIKLRSWNEDRCMYRLLGIEEFDSECGADGFVVLVCVPRGRTLENTFSLDHCHDRRPSAFNMTIWRCGDGGFGDLV